MFIVLGCKVLCIGGIILVKSIMCEELDKILVEDLFNVVVYYEVIEFIFFMIIELVVVLKIL